MRINLEEKVKHATAVENQSVNEKFVPITSNLNTNVTETALSEDTIEEDIIECTICAELIPNYQPTLFFGVEINPACDMCNPPSKTSSENLSNLSKADLERKHNKEDIKPREKIRLKVQKKLKVKFENGEISREEMKQLEEDLVKELEEELVNNLGEFM